MSIPEIFNFILLYVNNKEWKKKTSYGVALSHVMALGIIFLDYMLYPVIMGILHAILYLRRPLNQDFVVHSPKA